MILLEKYKRFGIEQYSKLLGDFLYHSHLKRSTVTTLKEINQIQKVLLINKFLKNPLFLKISRNQTKIKMCWDKTINKI